MEGGACGRAARTRRHHSADSGGATVASRFDMRRFVAAGFILAAYEVWQMSRWSLDVSMHAVLVPIFLFGMGLGAVFPTITALGIGQIRRERMGFAASLFGMMVSAGAATGIAVVTNALTARHQLHQASLYAHLP